MIKFVDMFSGIGGFREGLTRAGGFECVGHCEIDKYANRSYNALFDTKGEWFVEDARKADPETMPEFQLLCGGFPCQAFSTAGSRKGFGDPRGTLFFELARLAEVRKPEYLLFENVPGLLNHDGGRTFATILDTLDRLGYAVEWQCIANLAMLDGVSTVFMSGIHSHDRNVILKYCVENNIGTFVIPRIGDTIMSGAYPMHMFHLPMLKVGRYHPQPEYLFIKRLLDIVISAVALVVLSPIFLITAISIKATDHGPVFYKQIRLTKDGKEFGILKFRSMRVDAEKDGVARLSSGDHDDRITPVGKVIRACRIDELPQLLNILRGELSIVGPRPERPEIAAQYCEEMPEFSLRLQAKAGLTGYAQIYGKYNTTPYDKLVMDLMYIAHPSIVEDLKIMFATVKILFMPESTEGVSEGQTTAMSGEND